MSPMPRNPFRGGVRSLAKALASCALAVSVATPASGVAALGAGAPALGAAAAGVGVPALIATAVGAGTPALAVGSLGVGAPALGAAAVLGAGALVLGPQQAWAETVQQQGDFRIEGDASGYSYDNGVLIVKDEADLTISTSGKTSNRIVVEENAEATITLDGVHIEGVSATGATDPVSAIDVKDNASLLLQLADGSTNTLVGGSDNISSNGVAGIHVPKKAELTILGAGSLTVTGGDSHSGYAGSGIGGNTPSGSDARGEACGTVVILATGKVEISGGKGLNEGSNGDDIGGGLAPPQSGGNADDGGGIRPTGDGSYVVWGEPALPNPPSSYTIPAGTTLTVPVGAALCIPSGVTLTNNGTITGEGNLNGDGILGGDGIVAVLTNNFQKDSALTLTIEGAGQASSGGLYAAPYDRTITLKAKVEQTKTRALSASDYNTVTFYVGTGDSKRELGTVKVASNEASLANVKITAMQGWVIGQNTITAEFNGHSHLKPAMGTATLTVGKGLQMVTPNAPCDVNAVEATSVTLKPVTDVGDVAEIEYGYTTDKITVPIVWQSSPTFENLTPATAYDFYTRYAENDFYRPSASSDTGLKVITAPIADAVTIDYEKETIAFDDDVLEVNSDKEFTGKYINNEGDIRPFMGSSVYVRAYSSDADAPIRGVAELQIPYRPESPSPKSFSESAEGKRDGRIVNLAPNADYQISTDNDVNDRQWTDCTTDASGVISNLAAGTYWVRTKATSTQFAGAADSVTIGVGDAITIIPPDFEPVYVGYDQPGPMRFTILNNSDQDVTLTSLSKTVGETFTVQGSGDLNSVVPAGGSNTSFTVQPGEKWGVGVHTATITAEYGNGQLTEAEVTFTVFPRMYPDIHSEVEREEGDKDWAPTVTYGNELVVNFETSYEADDSEGEPGEGVPEERAVTGSGADEGPEDSPAAPALVAKGRVSLYLGDTLLSGPVAYEGGDIALTYDTRGRDIPVSDKAQELTVVFEGENDAPDKTYKAPFKLVKAPAAELAVSGDHVEGSTLEAGFPDARNNAGASFQWLRDDEPIAGATRQRYRLTSGDVGHEVIVRATSPWFEGVSSSAAHGDTVMPAAPPSEEVPPSGDTGMGEDPDGGTTAPPAGGILPEPDGSGKPGNGSGASNGPDVPSSGGGTSLPDGAGKPKPGDKHTGGPSGAPDGTVLPETGDPATMLGLSAALGMAAAAAGMHGIRRKGR